MTRGTPQLVLLLAIPPEAETTDLQGGTCLRLASFAALPVSLLHNPCRNSRNPVFSQADAYEGKIPAVFTTEGECPASGRLSRTHANVF